MEKSSSMRVVLLYRGKYYSLVRLPPVFRQGQPNLFFQFKGMVSDSYTTDTTAGTQFLFITELLRSLSYLQMEGGCSAS